MHKESPLNFEKRRIGFLFPFLPTIFSLSCFQKEQCSKRKDCKSEKLSLSLSLSLSCCFLALGSFFYTAYSLACFIVFPLFQKRRFLNVVAAGLTVLRVTDNVSVLLVTEYFIFYFVYSQN
jgi:hypothetical protein